ncbi:MAG4530 family protein [Mycoplasmopsis arginini]|uniref:MAG4530 family protein n=1 Tax=Mycoplasmopsis arginini TaxID=2094 RepID=UPI00249EDDBD|nr:hypothetical protein [Mycoplasmopsis arginini]MDI3351461.1 hypothetical protein [Mycoplasmopsis arginini]MDI3352006.1 hypothetical protein [Mycoplasmopsis arginini]
MNLKIFEAKIKDIYWNNLISKQYHNIFTRLIFVILIIFIELFISFVLNLVFTNLNLYFIVSQIILNFLILLKVILVFSIVIFINRKTLENNFFNHIFVLNKLARILFIKNIKVFLDNTIEKYNKNKTVKIIEKLKDNVVLQGSASLAFLNKPFWRNPNDIDLLFSDPTTNLKKIRENISSFEFLVDIFDISYIRCEYKKVKIEILPTKVILDKYIDNSGIIKKCNLFWQIAMKLFQLMEHLLKNEDNSKILTIIIDIIWLFSNYENKFKNIKKVNEALNYLLLSNYFVYYFFPYKKRITNQIKSMNLSLETIFKNNYWLNLLNLNFFNFFVKENYLEKVFDKNIKKRISKISNLLSNKEKIWNEILNNDKNNNLREYYANNNLKPHFWKNFDIFSKNMAKKLQYNPLDIRCYLLTKLKK